MNSLIKTIRLITLMVSIGCWLIYGCAPLRPLPPSSQPLTSGTGHPRLADPDKTLATLLQQLDAWEGVPYRLGGLTKKGVDCSGFVYTTYLTQFNIRLPRATYQQSKTGDPVFQDDLRAGDLVFFRIGYTTRHVGIYLEDGQFMHASKSKGVMRSSLQNEYWSRRYWKAIRIKIDRH